MIRREPTTAAPAPSGASATASPRVPACSPASWSGSSVTRATPRTTWPTCTWRSGAPTACRSTRTGRCSSRRRGELHCAPADEIDDDGCASSVCRCHRPGSVPTMTRCAAPDESELDVSLQPVAAPGAQSVSLSSMSTPQQVERRPVRPGGTGPLEQVTVTLTVDAGASVEVTNLTPAAKPTTVVLDVSASAAGPGVGARGGDGRRLAVGDAGRGRLVRVHARRPPAPASK